MHADTALPGLKFDVGKQEISFEWEDMLCKFFREEVEVDRRVEPLRSRVNESAAANRLKLRGPDPELRSWLERSFELVDVIEKATKKHRRAVRRARIMEHYRAHDDHWLDNEYPWDEQEEARCRDRVEHCGGFWIDESEEADDSDGASGGEESGEESGEDDESAIEESDEEHDLRFLSDKPAKNFANRIDIDDVSWGNPEDSDTWDDVEDEDDDDDDHEDDEDEELDDDELEDENEDESDESDADSQASQDKDSNMYKALRFRLSD